MAGITTEALSEFATSISTLIMLPSLNTTPALMLDEEGNRSPVRITLSPSTGLSGEMLVMVELAMADVLTLIADLVARGHALSSTAAQSVTK
jgi:hypothetical protein